MVVAERVGDNGSRQLLDVLAHGRCPARNIENAKRFQQAAQGFGVHRLPDQSAGEQPA
ncbi:hypothetical protein OH799_05065 [Nocardia sp. NBC_00881]|uniref:hypothetical protein n=1 Tax=Nocardia sp. NBC_00881 TaxID=2975995 RepID=UPI003863902C|nr:hypothetical protein OH799_05065 [Nocardia sp. NBC_00881]